MSYRAIFCLLVILLAAPLYAQFIGDTLAAAGFAESEEELMGALVALSGGRPQATVPPPEVVEPAPPPEPTPMPDLTMPAGPGYSVSGGGRVSTPAEAAAWKAAYLPDGSKVASPPAGSETVKGPWGTLQYAKGLFFKQQGNQWVVVPAPVGAQVADRPAAASMIAQGGNTWLYYNGAFYVWNGNYAEVVAPPVGLIVTNIPANAVKKDRNGPCYEYNGTCFRPKFRGQNVVYVVG